MVYTLSHIKCTIKRTLTLWILKKNTTIQLHSLYSGTFIILELKEKHYLIHPSFARASMVSF